MFNYCIGKDLTVSELINKDEGYLSYLIVHPTATSGSIIVRDGDSNGEIVFKANVSANGDSKFFSFAYPIKVRKGIYVELNSVQATVGYFG